MIINCEKISKTIEMQIQNIINEYKLCPSLVVIQIGDNKSFESYIKNKSKKCCDLGIEIISIKLPRYISQSDLNSIVKLNSDNKNVDGIIILNPIPTHLNYKESAQYIVSNKDVDGANIKSNYISCTAKAVLDLLDILKIELTGKDCVVVGRGIVSGEPISKLLEGKNATVIKCNSFTKDIKKYTKSADIVISAIGVPKYITKDMTRTESIIIDVGICNDSSGKLCGDADTESLDRHGCLVTPVPKGIGLITTAELLLNTTKSCYEMRNK